MGGHIGRALADRIGQHHRQRSTRGTDSSSSLSSAALSSRQSAISYAPAPTPSDAQSVTIVAEEQNYRLGIPLEELNTPPSWVSEGFFEGGQVGIADVEEAVAREVEAEEMVTTLVAIADEEVLAESSL